MSIFEYIDEYGKYSFEEREFNEVDNAILSLLSYLDLSGIISCSNKNKRSIGEVSSIYFKIFSNKEKNFLAVDEALKVFKAIGKKKRYKDILMYGYSYVGDFEQQFCAISLDINSDVVYVSFEGTDHLISGWEEDFRMTYEFPVLSQKRAINYVNKHFTFSSKKLIFGGHSKGGNLAMVASMYCNFLVKNKIIRVYNNDGPGLRKKQFESWNYKNISSRLVHIVPNYTIVGLLLRHTDNYQVVKSNKRNVWAHSVLTWEVEDNSFKRASLSSFSKAIDKGALDWLLKYDDIMRKKFFTSLFDVFRRADVHNLLEIMDNEKVIIKIIRESSNIEPQIKDMFFELFPVILKYYGEYQFEKIKDIF